MSMSYGGDTIQDTDGGVLRPISSVMRNRIINGAMVIDQRNAGASVSTASGSTYSLDRWYGAASVTSKYTMQQNAGSVTPPVGFTNYLGVTSSSAYSSGSGDKLAIAQFIEGYNTSDLNWGTANAKTVTLSAWVYSSLTGTFGGAISNYANTRSYPFTYTISSANTWTQISVTIVGDTSGSWTGASNTGSIDVWFNLGCGTSASGTAGSWASADYRNATGSVAVTGTSGATWYITGVQLEVGSQATGFEYRQYQQELALCQRYYFKSDMGNQGYKLGSLYNTSLTRAFIQYDFHVTMRSIPTVSYTIGAGSINTEYLSTDFAQLYMNVDVSTTNITAFSASSEL